MKKTFKPLFFIFFILLLSCNSTTAVVFSDINALSINNGNGYGVYESEGNVFVYHNETAVFLLDYTAPSSALLMTAPTGWIVYDAFVATDNHLYIATNFGIVRRNNFYTSPQEIDTTTGTGNSLLITTTITQRLKEESGYIYYFNADTCYRFSLSDYLTASYLDTDFPMTTSVGVADFEVYNGDIYFIGYSVGSYDWNIYKNKDKFYEMNTNYGISGRSGYLQLVDGGTIDENFIMYLGFNGYSSHGDSTYKILYSNATVYKDFSGISFQTITSGARVGVAHIGNLEPSLAWINYPDIEVITSEFQGKTIASVGIGAAELSYGLSTATPISSSYYNNSDLDFAVNIATTEMSIVKIQSEFSNYEFLVKLFDNNDAIIETYTIKSSEFKTEVATDGIIGWFDWLLLGDKFVVYSGLAYFDNTNTWDNGTYIIKLYEHNIVTGNLALLDTSSLEILETQFNGSVTTADIDSIDTSTITDRLLDSPYFFASIIILGISLPCAAIAGGVGLLGGLFISVVLCVGIGIIPQWTVLLMFVVCLLGILSLRGN